MTIKTFIEDIKFALEERTGTEPLTEAQFDRALVHTFRKFKDEFYGVGDTNLLTEFADTVNKKNGFTSTEIAELTDKFTAFLGKPVAEIVFKGVSRTYSTQWGEETETKNEKFVKVDGKYYQLSAVFNFIKEIAMSPELKKVMKSYSRKTIKKFVEPFMADYIKHKEKVGYTTVEFQVNNKKK